MTDVPYCDTCGTVGPWAWHFPLLDVRPAWSAPRNGALGVWRIE